MSDSDTILHEADKAFAELDKARRAVVQAEAKLNGLRQRYSAATGTFGLRLEALRIAVDVRFGRRAA